MINYVNYNIIQRQISHNKRFLSKTNCNFSIKQFFFKYKTVFSRNLLQLEEISHFLLRVHPAPQLLHLVELLRDEQRRVVSLRPPHLQALLGPLFPFVLLQRGKSHLVVRVRPEVVGTLGVPHVHLGKIKVVKTCFCIFRVCICRSLSKVVVPFFYQPAFKENL